MIEVVQHRLDAVLGGLEALAVEEVLDQPGLEHLHVERGAAADGETGFDLLLLEYLLDLVEDDETGAGAHLEVEPVEDHAGRFHHAEHLLGDARVEGVRADLSDVEGAGPDALRRPRVVDLHDEVDIAHREGAGEEIPVADLAGEKADVLRPERVGEKETERSDPVGGIAHQAVGVSPSVGDRNGAERHLDLDLAGMELAHPVAVSVAGDDPREEIAGHQVLAHPAVAGAGDPADHAVPDRVGEPRDAVVEEGVAIEKDVLPAVLAEPVDDELQADVAEPVVVRVRDRVAILDQGDHAVEIGDLALAGTDLRAARTAGPGIGVRRVEGPDERPLFHAVDLGGDGAAERVLHEIHHYLLPARAETGVLPHR